MPPQITFDRGKARVKEWDDQLTPLEIAAALETDAELPFAIAPMLLSGQRPVSYSRDNWSEDASYYTSHKGAKRLIVCFTGASLRLGVPISCFLQMLRDDQSDVIVLRDPHRLHYANGIRGLGGFVESMTHIRKFADAKGFQQVITFGCSLGGFPALRAGRLLGARRAFSMGGRYPWHPGRLVRGETPLQAYDMLCACASPSPTELVSVYAVGNERDTHANAHLRKTFPSCIEVPIDVKCHGIIGSFYRARLLPVFLACLFDYWDEVEIRTDLFARLEHVARHALQDQSLTQKRLEQERERRRSAESGWSRAERENERLLRRIDAVHDSHSWRVTSPLRAIARVFFRQLTST